MAYPWENDAAYTQLVQSLCERETPWSDVAGAAFPLAESALRDLRLTLSASEIERCARLGRDATEVVHARGHAVLQGEHEEALARNLSAALLERGIVPTTILVGADERAPLSASPSYGRQRPEACAARGRRAPRGLWVSCTRMVSVSALTEDERRAYQTVIEADAAYMDGSMTQPTLGDAI